MPTNVVFNGTTYPIPNQNELNWSSLTGFLVDVGNNAMTKAAPTIGMRVATATPVTVNATTDAAIVVNLTTPGASVVNLPAGVSGRVYVVVDGKGDAETNNLTVNPPGGGTINGGANFVINRNRGGIILAFTGTEYVVIGSFIDDAALFVQQSEVGQPNGVASLDGAGDVPDGQISESSVRQHEGAFEIAASQVNAGQFDDARISESSVLQHEGALTIANLLGVIPDAKVPSSAVTQHQGDIDHDALTNFVANEHIDWTNAVVALVTTQKITGLDFEATGSGANRLPVGDNAQRPANQTGLIRYNSETGLFEGNNGSGWVNLQPGAVSGPGTVPLGTIIALNDQYANVTPPANGVISSEGFALCNGQAVSGLTGNGLGSGPANLPDLTDGRFLRGSTTAGGTGGADAATPSGTVSSSFSGNGISYGTWFQNNNYTPSGTVTSSGVFNANLLNGTSKQFDHTHGAGSYVAAVTHFSSTSLGSRIKNNGVTYITTTQTVVSGQGGGLGNTQTGREVTGTGGNGLAAFRSTNIGVTVGSSFSGSGLNKRSNWATSGNYTPSGSVSSSFSGSSLSTVPKYFNAVYIMRVK